MALQNHDRYDGGALQRAAGIYPRLLFVIVGLFFGLALLKFGNPVIFEGKLPPPSNLAELIHFNWPIMWGWGIAAVIGVLLLPLCRLPSGFPRWLLIAPGIWSLWQWVATFDSIQPDLSRLTAVHLNVVAACFYFGLLATRGILSSTGVWLGIGIGLCLVIFIGFQQQFGGLEEARVLYEKLARGERPPELQGASALPELSQIWQSPLFQARVKSARIYATLFYPNTLAGVILLLTPGLLGATWIGFQNASPMARRILLVLLGFGAVLCLIWSGSKAGQVIALLQLLLLMWILLQMSFPAKCWRGIVISMALVGMTSIVILNLNYFQRGAKSVGARTDYWVSAGQAFLENPVTGTGPGTFGEYYRARKLAESEMAWLAHNDVIQQASDSGGVGFVTYLVLVVGALTWSFKRVRPGTLSLGGLIGLGLVGWAIEGLWEFGLYIPAVAWPAHFLLGSLCREAANRIDSLSATP